ncbi:hypothetical protein Tco_1010122, partial [Tanacetum coccineum]
LPVAPARESSDLETSVDKLFDEGGSGDQAEKGDFASGGQGVGIHFVSEAPSHPAKKLRGDHDTPGGTSVAGKSRSAVQMLLARAVLNPEVGIAALPTFPFVTSPVSTTPEHEGGDQTDSVAKAYLRTISAPQRFVISSDSSHHSGANVVEAEVDYVVRSSVSMMTAATTITSKVDPATTVKEKFVESSLSGGGSSSAGGADHTIGGFSDLIGNDFIVSGISALIWIFRRYNIKKKRRLKSTVDEQAELLKVREVEIENLKAQLLLKEGEAAEAIRLRAKASKFEAIEKSLQDEVKTLKDHNVTLEKEKNDLGVKVADLAASVKVREQEVADLDALVTSVKFQKDNLVDQDEQMKIVNERLDKLYVDFVEMALHLEEKFYPHLLTTISGRRWLLTHGMELAISKCLNSTEYLSALGVAISKAVEKGMQDGLSAGFTHGTEGKALTNAAAYNLWFIIYHNTGSILGFG